jgi:twitching motility protein PilT
MAAIDSMLRLIQVRNAELLVIASDEVPQLRRTGEVQPLTMPAVAAPIVAAMVGEVLDDLARAKLKSTGSVETSYTLGQHTFSLFVEARGDGYRIACRPAAGGPAPRASTPSPAPPRIKATELHELLRRAAAQGASDVLLSAGQPPRMRLGGELTPLDPAPSADDEIRALLDDARRAELERHGSADTALDLGPDAPRFRVNVFRQRAGLAAALRPVRRTIPTLDELHLPSDLHDLVRYPSGLVLLAGRAGSGKSTTLAALIEHLNRTRAKHIITLEDPIEYEYEPRRCLIHQREVGAQLDDFASGLRASLRESPDVLLVGEMRDRETIAAALTAAETGHLVLSTVHSASAAGAIDRIVDVFPEHQQTQVRLQLALVLRAVVSQVLVAGVAAPARFPAYEKMVVTPAIASQIRDGKLHQIPSLIQTGRDHGMVPLERTLEALVRSGTITRHAANELLLDR